MTYHCWRISIHLAITEISKHLRSQTPALNLIAGMNKSSSKQRLKNESDPWEALGFNQLGNSPFEVNNSIFPHRVFQFSASNNAPSQRAYTDMEKFLLHNRQFDTSSFLESESTLIEELQRNAKGNNAEAAGYFGCEDFFARFGDLKSLGDKEVNKMEREPKLVKMIVEQGVRFINLRNASCLKKVKGVQRHKRMKLIRVKVVGQFYKILIVTEWR